MGAVLVVEDDLPVQRSLERWFQKLSPVVAARTAAEAQAVVRSETPLAGALIDARLPDGSGLELLAEIRARDRTLPVVIMSAHLDRDVVNRTFLLHAHYVNKPLLAPELERVGDWMREHQVPITPTPETLAIRFSLTRRESELLALSLRGLRRDVIRERLGIRESTIKKTVSRLLRKFDACSLREVAEVIASEQAAD
jgi:two-component system response regulator FixJ